MKFVIFYSNAGFGLAKDAAILSEELVKLGHPCEIVELESRFLIKKNPINFFLKILKTINFLFFYKRIVSPLQKNSETIAIHLETIYFRKLFLPYKHILIPNQEWFDVNSIGELKFLTAVWTKSNFAKGIFSEFTPKVRNIGFKTKIDPQLSKLEKNRDYFFCRVGKSRWRGHDTLLSLWARHPEWPTLKVLADKSIQTTATPQNFSYVDVETAEEYASISAASYYQVFPTESEGFGHSIIECLGYGNIAIVTNAPPMSEYLNAQSALLVPSKYSGQIGISPRFKVDMIELEALIEKIVNKELENEVYITDNALKSFSQIEQEFQLNLLAAIKAL